LHYHRPLEILEELGNNPASPLHEHLVSNVIKDMLDRVGAHYDTDPYGNIVAFIKGSMKDTPPLAFVSHMDHPGFEVDGDQEEDGLYARVLGGVPVASIVSGMEAFAFDSMGNRFGCKLLSAEDHLTRRVRVESEVLLPPRTPIVFQLEDYRLSGDTIRMRALDDLAGCAAIVALMERLVHEPPDGDVYGIFTRAEEIGLIGARLIANSSLLPPETFVVSVETSSVIPGVELGLGPIIRTGDASFTFSGEAEQVLILARNALIDGNDSFKSQRQLMKAGTCEATAFAVRGYRTTGMAFALGNWHNATTSIGDPDGGVAEEYISVDDFLGGVDLIHKVANSVRNYGDSPPYLLNDDVASETLRRLSCEEELKLTIP
jgi:endoglucanase